MSGDIPSAQVTVADLYRELVDLRGLLTRSLGKLEVIESRNGDADQIHRDHETRLRALEKAVPDGLDGRVTALEKFAWKLTGALVLINALIFVAEWALSRK